MGSLLKQVMEIINECRMLNEAIKQCPCTGTRCHTCISNHERIERKLKVVASAE